jgi:AcrR family transcriptional regulator
VKRSSTGTARRSRRPGEPARRHRLLPLERERLIVDGAVRYFAEAGFGGQTRELSRRLGITQPLLYRYFPSKQALIERVYREVFLARWDPTWETLLEDRRRRLRDRLVEFYRRYTAVIFRPEWIRLYMYSGLAGMDLNRRYIELIERLLLRRIAIELRAELGLPGADRRPIVPEEIELVWVLHAGIFYYGVRKFIYRAKTRQAPDRTIEHAIDSMLGGAPAVLRALLAPRRAAAGARRKRTAAPRREPRGR